MKKNNKLSVSMESHTKKKLGFKYLHPIDRSLDNSRNSQNFVDSRPNLSVESHPQRPSFQLIRLRMTILSRPRDSVTQIRLEKLVNEQLKTSVKKTRAIKLEEIDSSQITLYQERNTIQSNVTDAYKQVKNYSENMSLNVARRVSRQERFESIMNHTVTKDLKDLQQMVEKIEKDRNKQFRIHGQQRYQKRKVTFLS